MLRGLCLVIFVGVLAGSSLGQQAGAAPGTSASTIPEGEAHFTPDQLKDYYLVYTNPDVRYLRTLFNAYLEHIGGHEDEFSYLSKWDSEYYRSKFTVCSRDGNIFGGTFITLMFQDKPDKIFIAWVYPEGGAQKLRLKAFDLGNYSDEDIRRTKIRYRAFLQDKEHAM
jgi:hypothetical protein